MKALIAAIGLLALSTPTMAADDSTAAEIAAMREEITALRSNMMSLNVKLADMQAMMRTMNATLQQMHKAGATAQAASQPKGGDADCTKKLATYKTKRDKLLSLGYTPEHPDVRNLNAAIKQLEVTCVAAKKGGQ